MEKVIDMAPIDAEPQLDIPANTERRHLYVTRQDMFLHLGNQFGSKARRQTLRIYAAALRQRQRLEGT